MSHGMTVRSTRTVPVLAPSKYGVQYKYEYAMTKSGTKGVRSVLRGNTYFVPEPWALEFTGIPHGNEITKSVLPGSMILYIYFLCFRT